MGLANLTIRCFQLGASLNPHRVSLLYAYVNKRRINFQSIEDAGVGEKRETNYDDIDIN